MDLSKIPEHLWTKPIKAEQEEPRYSRYQRKWWWITAKRGDGRDILIFGGASEEEANRRGYEKLAVPFEITELPTKDITAASRMIKGRRIDTGLGIDKSMEKLSHKTGFVKRDIL